MSNDDLLALQAPVPSEAVSATLLKVEKVSKRFGSNLVLDEVDLTVAESEVVTIIGPSGSGKSTLLRCINFIAPPDSGRVWFNDRWWVPPTHQPYTHPIRTYRAQRELTMMRGDVGMVFQHFNVFPHMTACQNVALGLRRVRGMDARAAEAAAHQELEHVGLGDKVHEHPARLSGGQKQRVAIARALALKPRLMLFDEATSALDPELVHGVLEQIRALARDGMTMVIVTHEMRFAFEVSDRIVFMDEGKIVEQGPPEQFSNPQHARTRAFLSAILEA